jgi:glycosyltransferase involved in cell wall biosynthesis
MLQEGFNTAPPGLVSVIIPAHNAQRFLPMTLAYARAQTYKDLEIIVVDDGSTDSTLEIAEEAAKADHRVRVVYQRNAGVAAARNRGIVEAHGDYVAPLDADDIWHPRNIALQVEALKAAGPDAALSYAWFVSIDERGRLRGPGRQNRLRASHQVLPSLMVGNFIGNGSSVVMRRTRVESVGGYDPSLRARGGEGFEDHALYLALAERWNFAFVPQYLIAYRRHNAAMSCDSRSMARSGALVLADLRLRRQDLRGYRLGRCHAAYYRELLAAAVRNREWSKLPAVLSCAAREGGAWCVLDLISRRVPDRIVDHWLYRLRTHRAKASPAPVDVFWPRENDAPASPPAGHVEEAHSTASEMELKTVI